MSALEDLYQQREELRRAISSGALKVVFRDREITYQTTANMLAALHDLEAQIASTEGRPRIRAHEVMKNRNWT